VILVKREKRLTKRERKALAGPRPGAPAHQHQHIHCVACGRHLDPTEFEGASATATHLRCKHGTEWSACTGCADRGHELLDTHDRTGQPVQAAAAWH
jgi:hypothetical protein